MKVSQQRPIASNDRLRESRLPVWTRRFIRRAERRFPTRSRPRAGLSREKASSYLEQPGDRRQITWLFVAGT
jgi:hypothetical protein